MKLRSVPPIAWTWLAFGLLLGLQVVSLIQQRPPFFEDDAAFFLRYADNLAAGLGYRWNAEEPPVWGASAPFWPLLLAAGVKLGLSAATASLLWSWLFTLCSTALVGLVVRRVLGVLGVLALAPLLTINHLYSTWATSGMESPLTFLLVAAALAVASGPTRASVLGVVAGLCLVHKIDLAPLGLALLGGVAIWRREQLRTALLVAASIAAAWYGFATWHFGSPLPNSFLRKLTADWGQVSQAWFLSTLTLGAGELRLGLAAIGLVALRKQPFLAALAAAALLVPALGYTLKPPSEPFMWYVAAVSPALAFLAACGLAWVLKAIAGQRGQPLRTILAVAPVIALAWLLVDLEYACVRGWQSYLSSIEPPLISAGEWIDRHAPQEARVLAGWGNVAYSSRRFVYDETFLNRRPEPGNLAVKYAPEVWVDLLWHPLTEFHLPRDYRIVQTFTAPVDSEYSNYSVVVMFRGDVPVLDASSSWTSEDYRRMDQSFRESRARNALFERIIHGEAVDASEVSEELLQDLERTAASERHKLAALSREERREAFEKAPWLKTLARRIEELRSKKNNE